MKQTIKLEFSLPNDAEDLKVMMNAHDMHSAICDCVNAMKYKAKADNAYLDAYEVVKEFLWEFTV